MVAKIFDVNSLRWMDLKQYLCKEAGKTCSKTSSCEVKQSGNGSKPPICNTQPSSEKPNKPPRNFLKLVLLGILGSGFVTQGVWNYYTDKDQTEKIRDLDDELKKDISSMGARLTKEEELAGNLLAQIDKVNKDLSSKITLDQVIRVVDKVAPSTVMVEGEINDPFFGNVKIGGSGVIVLTEDGRRFIITNEHVTEGTGMRRDGFNDDVYHIKIYNGSDYKSPVEFDAAPVILKSGTRAHSSPNEHDLALLEIPPDVKLAESVGIKVRDISKDPLKPGESVIAVGSPFANRDTVTFGIISHADRNPAPDSNRYVQTDTPINPGNSGGGLFDMEGNLIGITSMGIRGSDGIGWAIRIDYIVKVLKDWGINLLFGSS